MAWATGYSSESGGIAATGNRLLLQGFRSTDRPGYADLTGENPDGSSELYLYDIPTETYTQITDSFGASFGDRRGVLLSENGDRVIFVSNGNLTGDNSEGDQHFLSLRLSNRHPHADQPGGRLCLGGPGLSSNQ